MTEHPVVEMYHATGTGIDNDILESFRDGARSDRSDEYRLQGSGLYVFTKREGALAHFDEVLTGPEGRPMIVTVEDTVNEHKWRLDVEAHAHILSMFVYDNFNAIYDVLDNMVEGEKGDFCPSESYRKKGKMVMKFRDPHTKRMRQTTYSNNAARNEEIGMFFSAIIEEIAYTYPEEVSQARKRWLEGAINSKEIYALKYVGFDLLPVKKLEVLDRDRWVEHHF